MWQNSHRLSLEVNFQPVIVLDVMPSSFLPLTRFQIRLLALSYEGSEQSTRWTFNQPVAVTLFFFYVTL